MNSVLFQSDFAGDAKALGRLSVNVAFLKEIKEENVHFHELLEAIRNALKDPAIVRPRALAELLARLRDELQTQFALEEFYGYFDDKVAARSSENKDASALIQEHATLFRQIIELVEQSEQLLYREAEANKSVSQIVAGFNDFYQALLAHEKRESELMMNLWNQDIGVGD